MPLTMLSPGESEVIKSIGGNKEVKFFLESLGFVVGTAVTVVAVMGGNLIVNIKDSKVAIGKDMALRIII